MALWGGRFTQSADRRFKEFNDSLSFDYRLAEQDIIGSIAWSKSLMEAGVLSEEEQHTLEVTLTELKLSVMSNPAQILESDAEDIHSWVESQLIDRIGNLGKKLHTGRSRNDQVATDLKLWCRQESYQLLQAIYKLQNNLVSLAETHHDIILPGFTHLQRAQPITFAHWSLAYIEMLERDYSRLTDCVHRLNTCPLGSGALAGTAYKIDREQLAINLGFRRATRNSLDSVSDRDHVIELLSLASISMMHLSRMAEDLIFYNSGEAGFIDFSDAVTSGSSLMPQKKNPDALELIRGRCGRVYGSLTSMLTTLKALPLAYNKDMQEDKEGLFKAFDTWHECLDMATLCLEHLSVNKDRMYEAATQGYSNATELADYLVSKQIPFREAHHMVGSIVCYAISKKSALDELTLPEFKEFSDQIDSDVYQILTMQSCLEQRDVLGGVAPSQVQYALSQMVAHLKSRDTPSVIVRQARLTDLDAIEGMVNYWANMGENLPRERNELVRNIGSFAVSEHNGIVTGCASLYVYDSGLAEIRSLGVETGWQSQGQGRALVQYLLGKAQKMAIKKVFALTRVPSFFFRLNFKETTKESLPEKVLKDCYCCPKLNACDETAVELEIKDASIASKMI